MSDDTSVERGQQWLEQLLQLAGMPVAVQAELRHNQVETSCWLTIDPSSLTVDQVNSLIGTDGTVLDSLQYLANTILNLGQDSDNQLAYTLELDGYRLRRQQQLQDMADQAVEQVRLTGQEFEMQALSSAERRQIHTLLKEHADLETYSRGQEPDRRLVVRLAQP